MFGIGTFELLVLAALALVVIGPEKFPDFAKIVIRTVTDIRSYVNDVKRDVEKEMRPVQNELRQLSRYNPEQYLDKIGQSAEKTGEEPESSPETPVDSGAPDTVPAGEAEEEFNPEPDGPSETPPAPTDPSEEDSSQEFVHPYERLEQEYGSYSPERRDR